MAPTQAQWGEYFISEENFAAGETILSLSRVMLTRFAFTSELPRAQSLTHIFKLFR